MPGSFRRPAHSRIGKLFCYGAIAHRLQIIVKAPSVSPAATPDLLSPDDLEQAIIALEKIVRAPTNDKKWDQIATLTTQIGHAYKSQYSHLQAQHYFTQALRAFAHLPKTPSNVTKSISLCRTLDELYDSVANRKAQADNLQHLARFVELFHDFNNHIDLLSRQAWLARGLGLHEKAIDLGEKMLNLYQVQQEEKKNQLAPVYRLLGIFYSEIDNIRLATVYHKKALALDEANHNLEGLFLDLNNLATVLCFTGDYIFAIKHSKRAQNLVTAGNMLLAHGTLIGNLGSLYVRLGQLEKANDLLRNAMSIIWQAGDREAECWLANRLALLYKSQGAISRALNFSHQYYSIATELSLPLRMTELSETLALLYCQYKDGKQALMWANNTLLLAQNHRLL